MFVCLSTSSFSSYSSSSPLIIIALERRSGVPKCWQLGACLFVVLLHLLSLLLPLSCILLIIIIVLERKGRGGILKVSLFSIISHGY